ncbi:MAG: coenzyme F420-0:L-glutamate ligase [Candidatus Bathyarchaeota archaeon]|nr:coenzyme F420-0:L-glutamate ligase [Candidatus Bathyarchaeota archaeon]
MKKDRDLISIIGLEKIQEVSEGDDIANLISDAAKKQGIIMENNDIVIITHKIVSKSEGRIIDLTKIKPSIFAVKLSKQLKKDPRLVEVILGETKRIVKMWNKHLITETHHGFVCPNGGIDESNVQGSDKVVLLPRDPDDSAKKIMDRIKELTGSKVAVIITDTFGRPWRRGQINVAIGAAGIKPLMDYRGSKDAYGRRLKVTNIAIADELASSGELVMNKTDNIPVAIVKGYRISEGKGIGKDIIRPSNEDLFR